MSRRFAPDLCRRGDCERRWPGFAPVASATVLLTAAGPPVRATSTTPHTAHSLPVAFKALAVRGSTEIALSWAGVTHDRRVPITRVERNGMPPSANRDKSRQLLYWQDQC